MCLKRTNFGTRTSFQKSTYSLSLIEAELRKADAAILVSKEATAHTLVWAALLLRKCRYCFQQLPLPVHVQRAHHLDELRMAHARAQVGPSVGPKLDLHELPPLVLGQRSAGGLLECREIELHLLLQPLVEERADRPVAVDTGLDLGGQHG